MLVLVLLGACVSEKQKELKPGERAIILTGTVFPIQEAEVLSPLPAVVGEVFAEPGQRVRAGQVLVRLDAMPYRADVLRAEAGLAIANANLAQARSGASEAEFAEARAEVDRLEEEFQRQRRLADLPAPMGDYEQAGILLDNAKARLERMYSLFAERVVSKPEVEAAQAEYAEAWRRFGATNEALERREAVRDSDVRIAEARSQAASARLKAREASTQREPLETARAQVQQAEADLARARFSLAQASIEAPIGGIVTEVKVQAGEKLYERSPVLTIKEIAPVQVKADVSPGLLPHIHVGQQAKVTVNTVPPTTVPAIIHRIQPVADPKTQSLSISLVLPNPDLKFQPGFTARVEIPVVRAQPIEPAK